MKRVIIGALVGTVIFFGFQALMWEGGFNKNISIYTENQQNILTDLAKYNLKDGLYLIPTADPNSKDYQHACEEAMKASIGKPWAMLFYHTKMNDMEAAYMIKGVLCTLIACLIAAWVMYCGRFSSFSSRFLVSMSFALFTLALGVLDNMNWWSYPWAFVKAEVMDLTLGWGICSLWLAFFVKNTTSR